MAMCQKCWDDAYMLSRWNGKSQADNYFQLLEERKDNPCTLEEQKCGKYGKAEDNQQEY